MPDKLRIPPAKRQKLAQTTLIPPPPPKDIRKYKKAIEAIKLTTHQGKIEKLVGLIYPTGPATAHPAANILLEFGTKGCPVNCGPDWSPEQIKAAIEYAAHPSAQIPEAAA